LVLNTLKNEFVCGFKNITGASYAGKSGQHDTDAPAVVTTNGAGPHNVQMFILSSDGTVLHCLPGYWAPLDLVQEIRFALNLDKTWKNDQLSRTSKDRLFKQANLAAVRMVPKDMLERSHLQSFDAKHEEAKAHSDFKYKAGDYHPAIHLAKHNNLKTTVQVVHERMAQRPYVAYEEFDVEKFSDYGKMRYDKKEETRESGARSKATK